VQELTRPLLALILGYILAGYAVQELAAIEGMMRPLWDLETFLLFYGVAAYSAVVVLLVLRWKARDAAGNRPVGRQAWAAAVRSFRERMTSADGAGVLLVIAILPLFMNAFGSWKAAIPQIQAFSWDLQLMRWDRLVHGGADPWRLLEPLLRRPWIVWASDYGYTLFIPAQTAVVLWQVWSTDHPQRRRFLISYVLAWMLLGTAAAIALSSAGPCFYGKVVDGPDPFVPLFDLLGAIHTRHPVGALEAQGILWASHARGLALPFTGISAMPSMHVALPMLFVLVAWKSGPPLRLLFLAYLGFNLVSSVLLGWHYAIDGYAAMLGVVMIWAAVGRLTRGGPADSLEPAGPPATRQPARPAHSHSRRSHSASPGEPRPPG
jgi:hypothetical protein